MGLSTKVYCVAGGRVDQGVVDQVVQGVVDQVDQGVVDQVVQGVVALVDQIAVGACCHCARSRNDKEPFQYQPAIALPVGTADWHSKLLAALPTVMLQLWNG
jgi:hypothetical protein